MSEEAELIKETEEGEANLEGGAYDVIRNRLLALNKNLLERVDKLNNKRKEVFGGQESVIIGNDRIQTENNCVARDIF
ncbi:MAG: DNA repair ATPase, partial [Lentisphaeria bacterium]|nr:DNA repair ATPase [Lentisphaeria bacterium]